MSDLKPLHMVSPQWQYIAMAACFALLGATLSFTGKQLYNYFSDQGATVSQMRGQFGLLNLKLDNLQRTLTNLPSADKLEGRYQEIQQSLKRLRKKTDDNQAGMRRNHDDIISLKRQSALVTPGPSPAPETRVVWFPAIHERRAEFKPWYQI